PPNYTMVMNNCTALARLYLNQGRLEEAKGFCESAQRVAEQVKHKQMRGLTYMMTGRVIYAEAKQTRDDLHKQNELLEKAITYFKKGKRLLDETQAYDQLAELYALLGGIQEELGRFPEALGSWTSGYQTLVRASAGFTTLQA